MLSQGGFMGAFHSRAGGDAANSNRGKNGNAKQGAGTGEGSGNSNGKLPPIQDVRLRKLVELIESEPLGKIHDWAGALNLSESHLQRLFKQATGLALGQLLAEKRLQRAANLLTNTNLSIKEIACAVGYEHGSSFTRAFGKRFEQAPRYYRMGNSWEEM
jgi:transcriptional regulator GlxA family with amidase domain